MLSTFYPAVKLPKIDAFISHAADSDGSLTKDFRDWIRVLTSRRCEPFVSSRSLTPGGRWLPEVEAALKRAEVTFVLLTPQSVTRPWVIYEWAFAHALKELKHIPDGKTRRHVFPISLGLSAKELEFMFQSSFVFPISKPKEAVFFIERLVEDLGVGTKGSAFVHRMADALTKIVHTYLESEASYPPVSPGEHGIRGVFTGTIGGTGSETLRSLKRCSRRLLIAGPSLSDPLRNKNLLRGPLLDALAKKAVTVSIFLSNPIRKTLQNHSTGGKNNTRDAVNCIKRIHDEFPDSNTCTAFRALATIYRALTPAQKKRLRVFLVRKGTLDFAILCDDSVILCRSTIYWPRRREEQDSINDAPEHDYKPPILEVVPRSEKKGKDTFFEEYRNYLESLALSAGLPDADSSLNSKLARKVFPVLEISEALRKGHA